MTPMNPKPKSTRGEIEEARMACQVDPWGLDHPGTRALLVDAAWTVYELSGAQADLRRYLQALSRMDLEQLAETEGGEAAGAFGRKHRGRIGGLFGEEALLGRVAKVLSGTKE